jgi:hypothetical protein
MRRLWEVLLVLLAVALPFYISEAIPSATIQRDAGAAVVGLVVCIALVVLWERNRLALRSPIVRKETQSHRPSPNTTYARPERADRATGPAFPAVPTKVERVYADITPAELFALGNTPNLTGAERALLLVRHVGKWLRIEGVVDDVDHNPGFVMVTIGKGVTDPVTPLMLATFGSDLDRVAALRKGARIRIAGKFTRISAMNVALVLDECELLN